MVTHERHSTVRTHKRIGASKSVLKRAEPGADSRSPAPVGLEIDLPDMEAAVDVAIVTENPNAVAAIYFAYQLEQMRIFQVIDRLVALFGEGLLPLGRGATRDYVLRYRSTAEPLLERPLHHCC